MTAQNNVWADVSSIAQRVEDDAVFVVRETNILEPLITVFRDMTGMNLRRGYKYNQGTAVAISDGDDLTSQAFTPSADQTLTPYEIGLQYFISDARAESDLPEQILSDAASELGFAASDKVMTDICTEFASLTGGTVGTANGTISWSIMAAAIAQARNANKNAAKPLVAVIHGYQWAVLAKSASIAGASVAAVAPGFQERVTVNGGANSLVANFMGVPIYQVFQAADADGDFAGGVFPREAIALDWRRAIRVRPQRDESKRGLELNMSAIYDAGVWRPDRGIKLLNDATAPSS
jgi:hypothetical protein